MHLSEFDVDLHDRLSINQQKVPTITETKKPNLCFLWSRAIQQMHCTSGTDWWATIYHPSICL